MNRTNIIEGEVAAPAPPAAAPAADAQLPAIARPIFNPLDVSPADFRAALDRRGANRLALLEWIRASLVDGVDYGAVPTKRGMSKPSLRKPGAEKICGMLNVRAEFPALRDYERACLDGRELRTIMLVCRLYSGDQVVAEGTGARSVDQDYGDLNKSLKMAEKSAHIDAVLRMAGLSEIFTQDIEDRPPGTVEDDDGFDQSRPPPPPHRPPPPKQQARGSRLATPNQVKLLRMKLDRAGFGEADLTAKFGIARVEDLPFDQVNAALAWIGEGIKQ